MINANFDIDAQRSIENSYKRSILDKVKKDETIFFKTSSIYSRLSVFAQFENDTWRSIDINTRKVVEMNCPKPVDVCIQFEEGINTMVDRGLEKR